MEESCSWLHLRTQLLDDVHVFAAISAHHALKPKPSHEAAQTDLRNATSQ
jgi:hypothetical protein